MEFFQSQFPIDKVLRKILKNSSRAFWVIPILVGLPSILSCTTTVQEKDGRLAPSSAIPKVESSTRAQVHHAGIDNPDATFSLEDRMLLRNGIQDSFLPPPSTLGPLYSFRAQELPLVDALALFARSNQLNIVSGPKITGKVTVDFHDLPLDRAMSALLEAHGYYWENQDDLIQVKQFKTQSFNIDYIRLIRGGTGQNSAQLNSGSSGSGSGGGQSAGEITVNQQDEIKFWEELEKQIQTLLSKDGRFVMNQLSGTIQITDWHQRVDEVALFLKKVHQALYRQVEIEVRIYEVNLNDNYSLGIDWNRINFAPGKFGLSNIITAPIGGFIPKLATTTFSIDGGNFNGVLEALQEQGELKVVSQPRIVTMNNQPALIKVATDQPFFTQTITQGTSGTGNIVTEQANSVTVGLVLSVTPQISEDGWIMLDVTPIISRLRDLVDSPLETSNAPVLDVKQSSGLVRLKDGETVIIGGLIQEETSETERKVPILGDIPLLGRFFTGNYTVKTKSELVIFISPKIVGSTS